jgi:hypothetical protein
MRLIIDRFEGHFAVCQQPDRSMLKIPRQLIPSEAREGDVLEVSGDTISLDHIATAARKKAAADKFLRLRQP